MNVDDDLGEHFVIPDPSVVYLDGNSLGRPTVRGVNAVRNAREMWGDRLVERWEDWIDLPVRAGDGLAPLLGRRPGSTILCYSVTVNLYKALSAVIAQYGPGAITAESAL